MLISYNWIQRYFDKPLPEPEELAAILTMHAFEIESVESKKSADGEYEDTILDVKVLPDRAPYCLSHRYMAQEIGALIRQDVAWPDISGVDERETSKKLNILFDSEVESNKLCRRYIGKVIEGISVTESPAWLRQQLEVLGQRSINSIVDLTNYITLETGEPLHAFDADKVEGGIKVRMAEEGEEITLLDGANLKLTSKMMLIADDAGPLVVAGIKGGKRAEVSASTKNIILEAACFDRTSVRRTSQAIGIRTESSKRFENGVTPERAGLAMAMLTADILKLNIGAVVGEAVDIYPHINEPFVLEVSIQDIYQRLGVEVPRDRMADILMRLGLQIEESAETLKLGIPEYRPDLRIAEDIAEEVGRVYGYDKVLEVVPPLRADRHPNKNFHYFSLIRKFLAERGFSEVYTYSLIDKGDMAVQNPLTVERSHMRNSITDLMPSKMLFNMRNIDLLALKDIRMFELGKIFSGKKERNALAFGIARAKFPKGTGGAGVDAAKAELVQLAEELLRVMGVQDVAVVADRIKWAEVKGDAQTRCEGMVAEIEIAEIIESLPGVKEDVDLSDLTLSINDGRKFGQISQYPFSARDIAVFVPGEAGKEGEVLEIIKDALDDEQKKLLTKVTLFDVFTKDEKTSYAYRLVFQANSRTLTQDEVDVIMRAISGNLSRQHGWQVR